MRAHDNYAIATSAKHNIPYSGYISRVYIFADVPLERFSRI